MISTGCPECQQRRAGSMGHLIFRQKLGLKVIRYKGYLTVLLFFLMGVVTHILQYCKILLYLLSSSINSLFFVIHITLSFLEHVRSK